MSLVQFLPIDSVRKALFLKKATLSGGAQRERKPFGLPARARDNKYTRAYRCAYIVYARTGACIHARIYTRKRDK